MFQPGQHMSPRRGSGILFQVDFYKDIAALRLGYIL
jgi:hypothetical protein